MLLCTRYSIINVTRNKLLVDCVTHCERSTQYRAYVTSIFSIGNFFRPELKLILFQISQQGGGINAVGETLFSLTNIFFERCTERSSPFSKNTPSANYHAVIGFCLKNTNSLSNPNEKCLLITFWSRKRLKKSFLMVFLATAKYKMFSGPGRRKKPPSLMTFCILCTCKQIDDQT